MSQPSPAGTLTRAPESQLQASVADAVARAVAEGEPGLAVCVYKDGDVVADVHAGVADEATGRDVDDETLFWIASVTKSFVAIGLHLQAERGYVDYEAPIAEYWPEFGVHGKERATVLDALSHRAGIPLFPSDTTPESLSDYDALVERIGAMHPLYKPGTQNSYHSYTFGYIVGEVIRRSDPKHRTLRDFIHEEVFRPVGADEVWLGIPEGVEDRVASYVVDVSRPGTSGLGYGTDTVAASPPQVTPASGIFMRPDVRRACHPGAGAIGNARSVARVYAMLADGGELNGVRLLSEERVGMMYAPRPAGWDLVLGDRFRGSIAGFWLPLPWDGVTAPMGTGLGVFGHTGSGGNIAWCDVRNRLAVAITAKHVRARPAAGDNPIVAVAETIRRELRIA